MITFKSIDINDKAIIERYTIPFASHDCENAFANLFSWHFLNNSSYAVIDDCLVLRFNTYDNTPLYLCPIGNCDKMSVLKKLDEHADACNTKFKIRGSTPELRELLEKYSPGGFRFSENRDFFDYVYLRKNLVGLVGKNYQPKRNHINKFKKAYSYKFTPLSPEILPYCKELESQWCKKRNCMEVDSMKCEHQAFVHVMDNYEELGMTGGAIWVNNEIVAFAVGSPINETTFDVQFEKADIEIDGAYSIINQEFASYIAEKYIYINREEDMGIPGLRKAKLSYHPEFMVEKCIAEKVYE